MNNNIFLKNKKYNPDIATNYTKKMSERKDTKFIHKNEFMNIDSNNSSVRQDTFSKDKPISQMDLLIQNKMNERLKQENEFKPSKNYVYSSNPNDFKQYNDLKNNQKIFEKTQTEKKVNKFNDILSDLENLGIIK